MATTINSVVSTLKRGTKGNIFCFATSPLAKIRKRGDLGWLHSHLVVKVAYYANLNIGSEYSSHIDKVANTDEYTIKPFAWQEWKEFPFLVTDKATHSKVYLVVCYRKSQSTTIKVDYYVDGVKADEALRSAIYAEEHRNDVPMSSTQVEAGVAEEDRVIFLNYNVDNIVYIKACGTEYARPCQSIGCNCESKVKELVNGYMSR